MIADHFFGETFYFEVRAYFLEKLAYFAPAGVGARDQNAIHKEVRNDLTYWLKRDAASTLAWTLGQILK